MTDFLACLAYTPHLKLVLAAAVALGGALGGMATAIALGRP